MQVALIIPAVLVPTAVIQAPTLIGSTKTPHAPTAFIPIIGKIIVPNEALQLSVVHPPLFAALNYRLQLLTLNRALLCQQYYFAHLEGPLMDSST
jgi:hypothetical protein